MDLIEAQAIKAQLQKSGSTTIRIVSDSMMPLIQIGETLDMQPRQNDLHVFDLIVFQQFDRLVCHYVWRNQLTFNGTVVTRSLKNIFDDEIPVPLAQVIGVVQSRKIPTGLKLKILIKNWLKGRL